MRFSYKLDAFTAFVIQNARFVWNVLPSMLDVRPTVGNAALFCSIRGELRTELYDSNAYYDANETPDSKKRCPDAFTGMSGRFHTTMEKMKKRFSCCASNEP